jgi:hypothetical protein
MNHGQGLMLAVTAGIMAAFGSVSAKLATSHHVLLDLCQVIFVSAVCEQVLSINHLF